jgi:hypothetical protein
MLTEFAFNLGSLDKFPSFVDSVLRNNLDKTKKEYVRSYVDAKTNKRLPLQRRNLAFYDRYLKK